MKKKLTNIENKLHKSTSGLPKVPSFMQSLKINYTGITIQMTRDNPPIASFKLKIDSTAITKQSIVA